MTTSLRCLLLALPIAGLMGVWRAEASAISKPYQLVRSLDMLNDQIVQGSSSAVQAQARLLAKIGQELFKVPPEDWKDARNVRALAVYLASGGSARAAREVVSRKIELGAEQPVVLALLSFAERRQNAAAELAKLDLRSVAPGVAGYIALAQAILASDRPEKALPFLAQARLHSPGTHVEEAALRREIQALLELKRKTEAIRRAAQYLWRFPKSIYADEVTSFLTASVLPDMLGSSPEKDAALVLLDELGAKPKHALLLSMTRNALLSGKIATAGTTTRIISAAGPMDGAETHRAQLYAKVLGVLGGESNASVSALRQLSSAKLDRVDAGILHAAIAVANRVQAPLNTAPAKDGVDTAVTARARTAIAHADQGIEEATR